MADANQHAREWDELGKIDYFLEHLARAVERGELHVASYEALAPRYLERRQYLADVIANRAQRTMPPTVFERVPPPPSVAATVQVPARAQVPVAPRPQPVVRKPVPWTTVLTITGAFLVIVASAIFAVATWDVFGVEFKLVFLGLLTAGFYGTAQLVRTRLKLAAGGVALTVVGSAMLLFDGWIAIDGYNLTGPWPWVGWLAVCSVVYVFTETALGGGFFGLTGAAAQVAWVWLLADGLGWPVPVRAAAVALVALLWAYASRAARKRPPFASLAAVLSVAAPITVLLTAFAIFADTMSAPTGWTEIAAALVVAVASTLIVRIAGLPSLIAVGGHAPAFLAIASIPGTPGVPHAMLLFGMAIAYVLYEISQGGYGYGVLALVAELAGWLALSVRFDWAGDVTLAVFVGVAASWSLAAYLLATQEFRQRFRGAESLRGVAFVGGWIVLAVSTLVMPSVREVIPLSGTAVAFRDVALAAGVFGAWAALSILHRASLAVLPVFGLSFYVAAAKLAWLAPEWHSALYATGLLAVAALWLLGRRYVERLTSLPARDIPWMGRFATALILPAGLLASQVFFRVDAWQSALLLAAMSAWWLLDALTAEEYPAGLAVSSAMAVACVVTAVATWSEAAGVVGWAGALAALALAGLGLALRSRTGWGGPWSYGVAFAGTAAALLSWGEPDPLAVALALAALTWGVAAMSSGLPELAIGGAAVAIGSLLSCAEWLDGGPWVTYALLVVPSFAALVPVAARRSRAGTPGSRWQDVALIAGLLGILAAVMVPLFAVDSVGLTPEWLDFGGHGLAASLLALGAYAMAASALRGLETGPYFGVGLVLLAYIVEWDTLGVGTTEWVSTPMALYVAWVGYRWARTNKTAVPLVADIATALIGLGVPTLLAANLYPGGDPWTHLVWAVALSLVAIALGVALRVRSYFFGGVAAITFTAIVRSWVYLVSFWWLVLGLIGITMLVVALTWEREQLVRNRVREALSDWR